MTSYASQSHIWEVHIYVILVWDIGPTLYQCC